MGGWISVAEGQAGGKEGGRDGQRGWWCRIEVLGSSGHTAHLFTLMSLQTPNSIHTLELERKTETEIRARGWVGGTEFLRPPTGFHNHGPLSPSLVVFYLDTSRSWVS